MSGEAANAWREAREAWRRHDVEMVLRRTQTVFLRLAAACAGEAMPGGFREADDLLSRLGRGMDTPQALAQKDGEGGDWILATCLYESGGHTALVRDLHETLPEGARGLILTGTGHRLDEHLTPAAAARTGLPPESVHRFDRKHRAATCREVVTFLRAAKPDRLFLLHHPDDTTAVAIAAAAGAHGCRLHLIHHADSVPSCGLFLRGARIADVIPRAAAFTKHVSGLRSDWLPLTCPDPGPRSRGFLTRGHLTTALTGSVSKISQASGLRMPEIVGEILRHTHGTHAHIGPLPEETRRELEAAVHGAGLPPDRLIHIPRAGSLSGALIETDVDLLINTWPMGGARAAVEAMAAAVPVVWWSPEPGADRFRMQTAWEGAPRWRRPEDWAELIRAATPDWLAAQSAAARARYDLRHQPAKWRVYLSGGKTTSGEPLPDWAKSCLPPHGKWEAVLERETGVREGILRRFQKRFFRRS